jgi:TIR domain
LKKQEQKAPAQQRDHLFISYATEDWPFVEWLALRLTAEGYKVWCDRFKLLGGESYPKDIDTAIKWRSFRFLTVLSHHSIKKPNPLKERTLALNLAREWKENFVVPINLDGISPTDLDWMVSDLTFISFHLGWAEGLTQLLKLLEATNAPREFLEGRSAAVSWFEAKDLVIRKQERLWLNLAEITQLPRDIYRYETATLIPSDERLQLLKLWPHIHEGLVFWAFEQPPGQFGEKYKFSEQDRRQNWHSLIGDDVGLRQLAVRLLNECMRSVGLARGLAASPDGDTCYFPDGLLPSNRLTFEGHDRKQTWLRCVGVRNFRSLTGKESCRYHLAPRMRVWLGHELGDIIQIRLHLYLTTLEGQPLEPKAALRRRKRICRAWWNHHWLARTFAVLQFIANNNSSIQIGESSTQRLVISKYPLTAHIAWALDESQLGQSKIETEEAEEIVLDLEDDVPDESEGAEDE